MIGHVIMRWIRCGEPPNEREKRRRKKKERSENSVIPARAQYKNSCMHYIPNPLCRTDNACFLANNEMWQAFSLNHLAFETDLLQQLSGYQYPLYLAFFLLRPQLQLHFTVNGHICISYSFLVYEGPSFFKHNLRGS